MRQELRVSVFEHLLPGVKLERRFDHVVVGVGEPPMRIHADLLQYHIVGSEPGLGGAVLQVSNGASVFGMAFDAGKMQIAGDSEAFERFDEFLLDGVVLVGIDRHTVESSRLLQPNPLKERALIEAGRCVGVVFVELYRPPSVIGEVHSAI